MNLQNKSILAAVLLGLSLSAVPTGWAQDFAENHPRRAEVMHRDRQHQNELNAEKGHLNGHYRQLSREDRRIAHQQRRDARMNGGHITRGEQHQLNREENHEQRQINRDNNQ